MAVENFTFGYEKLTLNASQNLAYDMRIYKWNEDTVNAIVWVLRNKIKKSMTATLKDSGL